jgi:peptide/nickel transport system permease protein
VSQSLRRRLVVLAVFAFLVASVLIGVPFWLVLVAVVVAAGFAVDGPARENLRRRAPRVALLMVAASCVFYVFLDVVPNASRVSRGDWSDALGRFGDWLGGVLRGDLGYSQGYSEPVADGLARTIGPSLQIVIYAQVIALLVVVPMATWAAAHLGGRSDRAAGVFGLFSLSMPVLIVGPLLIFTFSLGGPSVFGVQVGFEWLPTGLYRPFGDGPVEHFKSLALPSIAMAAGLIGPYFVTLRTLLVENLHENWVLGAAARGLPPRIVIGRHALRPAWPVFLTQVAASTTFLAGNLLIVERIFTIPGLADYLLVALGRRDAEAAVGATFLLAAVLALVNLLAETYLLAVDPVVAESERRPVPR